MFFILHNSFDCFLPSRLIFILFILWIINIHIYLYIFYFFRKYTRTLIYGLNYITCRYKENVFGSLLYIILTLCELTKPYYKHKRISIEQHQVLLVFFFFFIIIIHIIYKSYIANKINYNTHIIYIKNLIRMKIIRRIYYTIIRVYAYYTDKDDVWSTTYINTSTMNKN